MADLGHNGGPPLIPGGEGWVAIHRSIREHWLVGFGQPVKPMDPDKGALSRAEAWIDLIMECRYEAGTVNNGGRKMTIQPGQLVGAISWLAARWNWTPQTVRTFLDKLEGDGMIERHSPGINTENNTQKGKQATVISVCNYSEYQIVPDAQHQAEQQANHTQATRTQHASNNIYKDNKETKVQEESVRSEASSDLLGERETVKERKAYSEDFEFFWRQYPDTRNNSKSRANEEWTRLSAADRKSAASSLPAYARYCRENKDYRCLHAERFLKHRRFEAYAETAAKPDANAVWWKDPAKVANVTDAQWIGSITKYANGVWPPDKLGPAPGNPRCVVPKHIIEDLKLTEKYTPDGISRIPH